jgi:Fe-S protein assembly co-chaperone HscB
MGVLRDPAQRAKHLLALAGRPLGEETSGGDVLGGSFLAEMLELRESVEDAPSEQALRALAAHNEARVHALSADLAAAFAAGDLDEATRLTARLQYLQRVASEIEQRREVT